MNTVPDPGLSHSPFESKQLDLFSQDLQKIIHGLTVRFIAEKLPLACLKRSIQGFQPSFNK